MMKRIAWLGAAVAAAATLIVLPVAHAVLAVLNFLTHAFVMTLQFTAARMPRPAPARVGPGSDEPFVSIHVPAHEEPPALLRQTLLALSRLDWPRYEVLVIDNNTRDPRLWRPIEALCRELGPRFRFLHVEGLAGYKAGAMNWARQFMDPAAEYIFVVDADYLVDPQALRIAFSQGPEGGADLVQFPQDYRNVGPGNRGIALDFRHFFASYMNLANTLNCVPSTGTLSLIRVDALRAIGGFDTEVVTEDADLGLRLSLAGRRAVYVDRPVGRGVLPHDLEGLKKQRWRWAFGNAQILKLNLGRILRSRTLTWRQKLGYVSHLTAWLNFNLVPSATLILLAPVAAAGHLGEVQAFALSLSAVTVLSYLVLRFGTLWTGLRRDGHGPLAILDAFATHLGLGWIFGASWLKCLWDHHSPFVRTNKFVGNLVPGPLRITLPELVLGLCLTAAGVLLARSGFPVSAAAAFAMGVGRFLVYRVWVQTRYTWRLSAALEEDPATLEREIAKEAHPERRDGTAPDPTPMDPAPAGT